MNFFSNNQGKNVSAKMIKSYYLERLERYKALFKIEITNQ